MLKLKKVGSGNLYAEYELFKAMPLEENGFYNEYADTTFEKYQTKVQTELKNRELGIKLKDGYSWLKNVD